MGVRAPGPFDIVQRTADLVVNPARIWIADQSSKWFCWVHLFDPHYPYARRRRSSPNTPPIRIPGNAPTPTASSASFSARSRRAERWRIRSSSSPRTTARRSARRTRRTTASSPTTASSACRSSSTIPGSSPPGSRRTPAIATSSRRSASFSASPPGSSPGRIAPSHRRRGLGRKRPEIYFESMSPYFNLDAAPLAGLIRRDQVHRPAHQRGLRPRRRSRGGDQSRSDGRRRRARRRPQGAQEEPQGQGRDPGLGGRNIRRSGRCSRAWATSPASRIKRRSTARRTTSRPSPPAPHRPSSDGHRGVPGRPPGAGREEARNAPAHTPHLHQRLHRPGRYARPGRPARPGRGRARGRPGQESRDDGPDDPSGDRADEGPEVRPGHRAARRVRRPGSLRPPDVQLSGAWPTWRRARPRSPRRA